MHLVSAVNPHINGRHVKRSANHLARKAGIPAVRSLLPPFVCPGQLWKGCPFVPFLTCLGSRPIVHPSC